MKNGMTFFKKLFKRGREKKMNPSWGFFNESMQSYEVLDWFETNKSSIPTISNFASIIHSIPPLVIWLWSPFVNGDLFFIFVNGDLCLWVGSNTRDGRDSGTILGRAPGDVILRVPFSG